MWSESEFDTNIGQFLCEPLDWAEMDALVQSLENPGPRPMRDWEASEVLEFIIREISLLPNVQTPDLQKFQCISGYIFKSLSEESCKLLSNSQHVGTVIFNAKERYIRCHPEEECFPDYYTGTNPENIYENYQSPTTSESSDSYAPEEKEKHQKHSKSFSKNGKRSEKLWEFLLHLLCDNETCPQLIKWENFNEGTFKFVQSNKVARLWGSRKKNANMTYEKFSRAMRYYYKSQVLLPVPGKRLVYKFGPQAKGWKNITPIS